MSALELGSLILAAEFALIAWAILFFLLRRQHRQIHSDHAHAGAVIDTLETTEVSRRDALATMFKSTYRLEDAELEARVDEYVAREKAFYQAMLSLYLERDGTKLADIPEELAKVLAPWANLTPSGMVDRGDIGDLESEKAELAAELENTKQTLDELMSEYSAAFSRNQPEPTPAPEQTRAAGMEIAFEDAVTDLDQDDFDFLSGAVTPRDQADRDNEIATEPEPEPDKSGDLDEAFTAALPDSKPKPPEPSAVDNANDILEYELAQEELEGLADLFDTPLPKG
jgi:hypothetical protein